jgi:DeoD family purine-nucleoside phosphorylase
MSLLLKSLNVLSPQEVAMSEFHLKCSSADIAKGVILVGDPHRAELASTLLSEPRLVNSSRGLLIYTGAYRGTEVTVASTGMGAPAAAIVLEELCNLGASVFIRVGSAGGLDPRLHSGDLVVATAAVREDGTSVSYLRPTFPAVSDIDLLNIVAQSANDIHPGALLGIVISHDAFYRRLPDDELEKLCMAGVLAQEMESSGIFIVAKIRSVRAAALFAIGGNLRRPQERSKEAFEKTEKEALEIGLNSLLEASRRGLGGLK